jgi:hypothetical protein
MVSVHVLGLQAAIALAVHCCLVLDCSYICAIAVA